MSLTQIELATDVCTQNTISKIEKHNIAPTVNILIKICLKLGLTLNDVFSDFSNSSSSHEESMLDVIERNILLEHIDEVVEQMPLLEGKLNNNDMKQYELINGVMNYWRDSYDSSLFTLDKVLQYSKSANDDIYTLLAYLFKGLNYLGQGHLDRTKYYFQMIEDSFEDDSKILNASVLEVVFICKALAKSFNTMKMYDRAYAYSQRGLKYANKENSSFFLDELNFYAAESVKNNADKQAEYEDYYNLAYYLAKSNGNKRLLKAIDKH